jgi:hypothetical protein
MLSKATYAPKDPILSKDVTKVCYLMIVLKDLPLGLFSLRTFHKHFP